MKRDVKKQIMKRKILDSALAEFSKQGYGASSINTICAAQNISKGIIYHYFETKDALFLACVEECFQMLTEYIRDNISCEELTIEEQLKRYFTIRTHFFREYPVYQRIFCEAIITPPEHLNEEIRRCRQDFDRLNIQILRHLLSQVSLRPDISKEEAIETFRQFQDFINIRYPINNSNDNAFRMRETICLRTMNILLYGVVKREESDYEQ